MHEATARALNALNLALYADRAGEWDAVRGRPWRGFDRAIGWLADLPHDPLRVLDVGCGNGRLAQALAGPLAARGVTLDYVGVDASAPLLERARSRAPHSARFALADLVESTPEMALPPGPFDVVALFGVLHAIPGHARRRALLTAAASRLAPGGLLVLTRWRFAECAERRRRIVPWDRYNASARFPIDPGDLEPGDHLLAFGSAGAVRYGHAIREDELDALLSGLPLEPVDDWYDDGAESRENHYALRRRV
jgi:SAM-dependent methyltransferase